jgi:methyl-accepting chemotaxis protein
MSNVSVKIKLIGIIIISLLVLSITITFLSISKSKDALLKSEFNKLASITTAKSSEIKNYFNFLESLLISLANHDGTKKAFLDFEDGFYKLSNETNLDIPKIKNELKNDFANNYISKVTYHIPNSEQRKNIDEYLPKDINGIIAQYIFITNNKEQLGQKNNLHYDSNFDNTYMEAHKNHHKTFDKFLSKFELYDIFMADLKGNLIYTDFKEKDFATNLKSDVYSNTGISDVYKKALQLNQGELAFDDFRPYEPSYNTPASFIATPIIIKGVKKGVLIFQMPVDKINNIMQFEGKFKESGLGESGESYLIASDYKMRSKSRFTKDIQSQIVQKLGTTIGVWEVKTDSTKAVLENNKAFGNWIIKDYRDISVLSSFKRLNIYNGQINWAIISEIDEEEALELSTHLTILMTTITIILLLITIAIMMYVVNLVVINPLQTLEKGLDNFFKFLNKENTNISNIAVISNDEIGKMTKVINKNIKIVENIMIQDDKLIKEAKNIIESVNRGNYNKNISSQTNNTSLNEFKDNVNIMIKSMKNHFININGVLQTYANYNYTQNLHIDNIDKDGSFQKFEKDINILKDSITQMLIENKTTGITLQNSANTLFKNVEMLSSATNQAAASLEETSTSLEQITSNISNNTSNVMQMSQYASEVTESTKEGQKLANQTTKAMEEINNEVTSINEAILIIDQIAFQTNILSLNAAVEAATAGEAGKGFAVVAGEVRNLASRSADAANDIKDIVQNATHKANNGKEIADNMIKGYINLNDRINKTLELINDVQNATQEQKLGIEHINEAIYQLDQQTQQNAKIANDTQNIAINTQDIANQIVENVNKKEFVGK